MGLASFVGDILGVSNPDTTVYGDKANTATEEQRRFGARESANYQQENDLGNTLKGTIDGTGGPTVAQTQLRQGIDQNNADAAAAAAGANGVNSVLARYQARQAQGEQAARLQQAAAQLRAQEVAQATAQLAQLRQAQAAQSMGLYGANLTSALGYDTLKAGGDQTNAQRDMTLGAAGLNGLAQGAGYLYSNFKPKGA